MRSWLVILLASFFALAACERDETPTPAEAEGKDGNDPQRIVSLAPSVTETLFALGAGQRVVGVTRFCDFPAETAALPKIGGLTDVDVETVLSLEPDLVVGVKSKTGSALQRTLQAAQIETLFLPVETFDDVLSSMKTLGARVNAAQQGDAIAHRIEAASVKPAADAPRVLVLFGREPFVGAGPKTFADEMIRRAGGRNALADVDAPYPSLDAERMRALTVDIIIDTSWGGSDASTIPAPKTARVVALEPALIRPGPRLSEALGQFRKAIEQTP